MALFNYSTMQMAAKIVYYGPGLGGKTTNLQYVYNHTAPTSRGEMVSLDTAQDRTLFFDLLPLEVGSVAGFKTRLQLYTVPGQVFYDTTRQLVLKGVDGVVFVADSQRPMLPANVDSMANLKQNLKKLGIDISEVPLVLQFNKRDLGDICATDEMVEALNHNGWPCFESSALHGQGVFETLKEITRLTLKNLRERLQEGAIGRGPSKSTSAPKPAVSEAPRVAAAPRAAATSPPSPADVAETAPPKPAPRAPARRSDVLAELEKLRSEALRSRPAAVRPQAKSGVEAGNGHQGIRRDIHLALKSEDLKRAERVALQLVLQDREQKTVHTLKDVHVDVGKRPSMEEILLQLNIAVSSRS